MDRSGRRVGLILLVVGCGSVDEPLATGSLRVTYRVTSLDEESSQATALIRRHREYVQLGGLDEVQISTPNWTVELVSTGGDPPIYTALVPGSAAGSNHVFSLVRDEYRDSATIVELPEAPELTAPASISRGAEPLDVFWSGIEGSQIRLRVEGDCIDGVAAVVPDGPGAHRFEAGELGGEGACPLTVTARRATIGTVDDDLHGGSVIARIARSVALDSTP